MLPDKLEVVGLNHLDMAGYIQGLQCSEFRVQRCAGCGHIQWPPRPVCIGCLDDDLEWTPLEGSGHLYAFTISNTASVGAYKALVPYVIGIVETTEGVRLLGHVDTSAPERLKIGDELRVEFASVGETMLPYWRSPA